MKIGIIGCGYVGLVTAACFAELGHTVVAVEADPTKLAVLRQGHPPMHERYLPELLQKHTGVRLQFCGSIAEAVQQAQIVFICVGTPSVRGGGADLSCVDAVVCAISRCLYSYLVVVEKSTVPPQTCAAIQHTLMANGVSRDLFSVAANPEFLREGNAVSDFLYPDRIVIGVDSERSRRLLKAAYRPLTSGAYYRRPDRVPGASRRGIKMVETNPQSAELIKHASNAFLAMKISFINAVANVAELVGADISDVRAGLGSDSRIAPGFLDAGIGYGGACLPKDLCAFRALADEMGCSFNLLTEVIRINDAQQLRFVEKVRMALSPLRGKRIAALGLAFKAGTDDIRESPAVAVVRHLLREGATVVAVDPAATDRVRQEFSDKALSFEADPYAAMTGANALIILTDWPEFATLDLERVRNLLRSPIVLDGRNLYSPGPMTDAGLNYISVGRPPAIVKPKSMAPVLFRLSEVNVVDTKRALFGAVQPHNCSLSRSSGP